MVRDLFQAVEVSGCHGLFDQFDSEAGVFHAADEADGFFRLPALVGVEADSDVRPDGLADGGDALEVHGRVDADFQFQVAVAARNGLDGVGSHRVRRVDADGEVRGDARLAAAEEAVQGQAVTLAEEVVDGHVQGGLGRRVVDHRLMDRVEDIFAVVDIPADEFRPDGIFNGSGDRLVTVTGDDDRRRCVAVARVAVVGMDLDDQVFGDVDAAQGRDERRLQGNGDLPDFNSCNLHDNSYGKISKISSTESTM